MIGITKYINTEIKKTNQKKYLELFMILDQISKEKNIISFSFKDPYLMVRVGYKDYYRINLKEVN